MISLRTLGPAGEAGGGRRSLQAVAVLGPFLLALAGEPAVACRPLTTEDASTAARGSLQLEASSDLLDWGAGGAEHILLLAPSYGCTGRLEASLEIPYLILQAPEGQRISGLGDMTLAAKVLLVAPQGRSPGLALKAGFKANTGDATRGLGSGAADWSAAAVSTLAFDRLALHAMLGSLRCGGPSPRNQVFYGVGTDYGLHSQLHLVAELSGSRNADGNGAADAVSMLVGAMWMLSEQLAFDAAGRFGLTDNVPSRSMTLGFSLAR